MNVLVVQRQSLVAGVGFSLSVYARIIEAMDWLRDQGRIQYAVCEENEDAVHRILRWADAVIFNKHFSERALDIARTARARNCITLLDLDDLVTAFPTYSGGAKGGDNNALLRKMLDLMDVVTVANAHLQKEILPLRADCVLVPNGIYAEKYPEPVMTESHPPRCVFTNADYLKLDAFRPDFIRVLQDFYSAHPEVVLDFYGDPFPELLSLPFIHYTGRIPYSEYIRCLAHGGYCFALTPLGGDEDAKNLRFNRCKNPFKFLNYGIAGIPGIYSDCEIYRDCIADDETGLLVGNNYEYWLCAMEYLLDNLSRREAIRSAGYQRVREDHHICKAAASFCTLLEMKGTA
jgi:hypothetical protein